MDNLLEALKTGSAFAVGREGKGRKRTPRAAGGKIQVFNNPKLWLYIYRTQLGTLGQKGDLTRR